MRTWSAARTSCNATASLGSQEAEIKSALQRLKEESGAEDLLYNTQNVNAAATLLQQKLGELVAATGGQIRAARVEIKPKTANYQPFAVNLTFATSYGRALEASISARDTASGRACR